MAVSMPSRCFQSSKKLQDHNRSNMLMKFQTSRRVSWGKMKYLDFPEWCSLAHQVDIQLPHYSSAPVFGTSALAVPSRQHGSRHTITNTSWSKWRLVYSMFGHCRRWPSSIPTIRPTINWASPKEEAWRIAPIIIISSPAMTVSLRPNLSPLIMTLKAPAAQPNSYTATWSSQISILGTFFACKCSSIIAYREALEGSVAIWYGRKRRLKRRAGKQATHDSLIISEQHISKWNKCEYAGISLENTIAFDLTFRSDLPNSTGGCNQKLQPCWLGSATSESIDNKSIRRAEGLHFDVMAKQFSQEFCAGCSRIPCVCAGKWWTLNYGIILCTNWENILGLIYQDQGMWHN